MTSMFDPDCPTCGTPLLNRTAWLYSCPSCDEWYEVCGQFLQPRPDHEAVLEIDLTDEKTGAGST